MTTQTITRSVSLESAVCITCGVIFAAPTEMLAARRRSKDAFYCPNGHPMVYSRSEEDRLKAELERAQAATATARESLARANERADSAERRRAAAKGQLTKALNRAQHGLCPHCKQRFAELEVHMAENHPHEPASTLSEA